MRIFENGGEAFEEMEAHKHIQLFMPFYFTSEQDGRNFMDTDLNPERYLILWLKN